MSHSFVRRHAALALILVSAATALSAAPAFAKMDCHASYEAAMTSVNSRAISPEHREAAFRIAHHAYDLCTIGDEIGAKGFFDKLNQN